MFSQFLSYSYFGLIGTLIHLFLMGGLINAGAVAIVSTTIGAIAGAVVNYYCCRNRVFTKGSGGNPENNTENILAQMGRFGIVALVCVVANGILFAATIQWVSTISAQLVATTVVCAIGYICNRYWTFRSPGVRTHEC